MLWIDILWMFYSAVFGGLVGGSIFYIANRKENSETIERIEYDIWTLKTSARLLNEKLSTLSVTNTVKNQNKFIKNNGNKAQRSFKQRV